MAAAEILKGKHVAPFVKLIITPASRKIYREAAANGTMAVLAEAGAIITHPSCGLCCGRTGGILTDGNFQSKYLSGIAKVGGCLCSGRENYCAVKSVDNLSNDKMTKIGYPFIDTCIDERISFLCTALCRGSMPQKRRMGLHTYFWNECSAIIDIGGVYEGNKNRNQD